jgi:hypothetical protein
MMGKRKKLVSAEVTAALEKSGGNVAAAARALGVSRQGLHGYIHKHPGCVAALVETRETAKDNVESVLYSKALAGEAWAVCFFLKTQAKDRGYTERQELTGKDGGPVTIRVVYDDDKAAPSA